MDGVVPAAGRGTRLRPRTDEIPKCLLSVAGKPILERCFERLLAAGVDRLVVVVGYCAGDVIAWFGDQFREVPIRYVHQADRNGLAHALLQAAPVVDDDFLLLNGDNVLEGDLSRLVERHRATDSVATALVERVSLDRARDTGVFELEDDRVVGMVEKPDSPPSRLVSAGCYAFSTEIFDACRLLRPGDRGEYELSDAIDVLIAAGATVETVELDGWRINVNTQADIKAASARLSEATDVDSQDTEGPE
ncbi:MAG: sugar phosphate nucleotidyltransferase [Natronomonas sp.]